MAGEDWPADLVADVAAISADDFVIVETSPDNAKDGATTADIDASLDLFAIAVRP